MSAVMEKEFILNKEKIIKLLTYYLSQDAEYWRAALKELYINKSKNIDEIKFAIACAILGQEKEGMRIPNNPREALFNWHKFGQFKNDKSKWIRLLQEHIEKDEQIEQWRNQCLSLGVIHPLEYSPITRQAFNWLFGMAQERGCVTDINKNDMIRRFQNLVRAYGGNVICYLFMKHEFKVKKLLNWNSNYFFERLIFDTYTIEQVMKIKKQELIKANQKLVKSVRID